MAIKKSTTVKEFTNKYSKIVRDDDKMTLLKSVVKDRYISYAEKCNIAERIVKATSYITIKDKNNNENQKLHFNSTAQYMLYCLNVVDNYSSITIDYTNCTEEFDMLNKNGVFDEVMQLISERELKELRMVLEMIQDDLIQNEYETHAFISNQVARFGELFGTITAPALEKLSEVIDGIDEKTIDKLGKQLDRIVKKYVK